MKFAKISMTIKQFLSVPRYKPEGVVTDAMFLSFQHESNFMAKATIRQHFAHAASFQAIGRSVLPARMDLTRLACDKGTIRLRGVLQPQKEGALLVCMWLGILVPLNLRRAPFQCRLRWWKML
jgi:hypothetical protein